MDDRVTAVLDRYHERMRAERAMPRDAAPGGRDGGQDQRMRAVGPHTGQLLNVLVRSLEAPTVRELGTSFGYSGIWLAEAARAAGGRVITTELHGYKSDHAPGMAAEAGLSEAIDFRVGDAVVADNVDPGRDDVRDDVEAVRAMPGMASVPLPVGQGLKVSRFEGGMNGSRPARGRSGSAA